MTDRVKAHADGAEFDIREIIASVKALEAAINRTTANALTAHAGGGQAGLALTADVNRVTTVATAADSVVLPAATVGRQVVVINAAAANAMNVFPATGDAINALAANTALSVVANKTIVFHCAVNGTWDSVLTA